MVFTWKKCVFLQTEESRATLDSNHYIEGCWKDDGRDIGYDNAANGHFIVAPYELIEWSS